MTSMGRSVRGLGIILLLALYPASGRAAACNQNLVECLNNSWTVMQPSFSAQCSGPPTDPGSGNLSYDLGTAHFLIHSGGANWSGALYCLDDYVLQGVDPGLPFTLNVVEHLKVSWSRSLPSGTFTGDFTVGKSDGSAGIRLYVTGSLDTTMAFPLAVVSGKLTTLRYALLEGAGGGTSNMTCDCSFANLPPGGFITSCQGYRQESPVASLTQTWGRCKAIYR